MKKFDKMELKSPSIPLSQRGRPQFPSLLQREGGEGLSLFQKAKFIQNLECRKVGFWKIDNLKKN
jgi:hypothetical protein